MAYEVICLIGHRLLVLLKRQKLMTATFLPLRLDFEKADCQRYKCNL
jgi:hypothetical protein